MSSQSAPPLLQTGLPGSARPQEEALAELRDYQRRLQKKVGDRIAADVLAEFLLPKPEEVFRWRVALDCGCVVEEWTRGRDDFPDVHQVRDPLTRHAHYLPLGERRCRDQDHHLPGPTSKPYREIVDWVDRDLVEHQPGPEHDPHGILDDELWAVTRNTEAKTSAHWTVLLDCGHYSSGPVTAPDWKPENGPTLVSLERQREMLREQEEWEAKEPDLDGELAAERAHIRLMTELRWPRPAPVEQCYWCPRGVHIIGYQRIGWLAKKPKPQAAPKPRRQVLEGRLAQLQSDQAKLEQELRELLGDD
jgi:hypothetical protein